MPILEEALRDDVLEHRSPEIGSGEIVGRVRIEVGKELRHSNRILVSEPSQKGVPEGSGVLVGEVVDLGHALLPAVYGCDGATGAPSSSNMRSSR